MVHLLIRWISEVRGLVWPVELHTPLEALQCSWFSSLCVQLQVGICCDLWVDPSWSTQQLALSSGKFMMSLSWSLGSENMKITDVVRVPSSAACGCPVCSPCLILLTGILLALHPWSQVELLARFPLPYPLLLSSLCSPPACEASPGRSC